jgi:nitrogen regulatory protein P-II 1
MKLIIAMVQPHKLTDVKQALFDANVHKMTVSTAVGAGEQKGYQESYRGVIHTINLLNKVKIEIAVNDDFVDRTVEAIIKGARTGNIGDGKILILDLPDAIRIRTGERGSAAIG